MKIYEKEQVINEDQKSPVEEDPLQKINKKSSSKKLSPVVMLSEEEGESGI